MTRIGAGWLKEDKNHETYISWVVDEEIQPLTITPDKRLISKPNKNKTNDDKQPDYYLELWKPKPKDTEEN